jgi:PEP-CTERM motif-containing protein
MFDVNVQGTAPVPEPGEWLLLLVGIAMVGTMVSRLRAVKSLAPNPARQSAASANSKN